MKYEMIFGDEALFDGCDENAVAVIDDMTGTRKSSKIEFFPDDALNFETVDVDSRRIKLAMRSIIKDKVDDENELENLYWEFDSQRSKKTTDERLLFKGKLRYYASIASVDKSTKEPKRWTWEDKKVGRLPEVGCDIQYIESQKRVSVVAINANEIVLLAKSNGSKFFVLDPDSLLKYYNPIETPAEKAQREEDEFIGSLSGADIHYGTVKELFDQGARAAYRKLKGGE